ncbi:hypothetical protein L6R50_01805 [Myxococcota bacterium]|nr:hypothetical protein [Myxococcota bacterium]
MPRCPRTAPRHLAFLASLALAVGGCGTTAQFDPVPDPGADDDSTPDGPEVRRFALASDFEAARVALVELGSPPAVLWEMRLEDVVPDDCPGGGAGAPRSCVTYEVTPRRARDGTDVVTVAWAAGDMFFLSEFTVEDEPVERWRLWAVDLLGLPGPQAHDCSAEPIPECGLGMAHDVEVLWEDASGLDLVIADTGNRRILGVRLELGSNVGVARWVIDPSAPGWPEVKGFPNDVDVRSDADGLDVLLSVHGGYLLGYRVELDAEAPVSLWRFPDDPGGFHLGTSHGPASLDAGDGLDSVYYAHSDGLSPAEGGTIGRMVVKEGVPDYRYDLDTSLVPGVEPLHFPRSVDAWADLPTPPLRLLVAESGCAAADGCTFPSTLRIVEDPDPTLDSPLTGAIGTGGAPSTLRTPLAPVSRIDCGFVSLYNARALTDADFAPATLEGLSPVATCALVE